VKRRIRIISIDGAVTNFEFFIWYIGGHEHRDQEGGELKCGLTNASSCDASSELYGRNKLLHEVNPPMRTIHAPIVKTRKASRDEKMKIDKLVLRGRCCVLGLHMMGTQIPT